MWLIIGIIFLIVCSSIISSEKASLKRNQQKYEDLKLNIENFVKKYVDKSIEEECRKKCMNKDDDYDKIVSLLQDGLGFDPDIGMIYLTMVGCEGKIPEKYARNGISIKFIPIGMTDSFVKLKCYRYNSFMQFYDKLLKKNGIIESLYYYPDEKNNKINIRMVSEDKLSNIASYKWHTSFAEPPSIDDIYPEDSLITNAIKNPVNY